MFSWKKCQCKTHHKILPLKNAEFFKNISGEFCLRSHQNFLFPKKIKQQILGWAGIPLFGLADIDSICVFFIFICKLESDLPKSNFRDVLFEVIVENETLYKFDTSHEFLENYSARNKFLKKNLTILV